MGYFKTTGMNPNINSASRFFCDSVDDIADLPTDVNPGSKAECSTGEIYVLTTEGEWVHMADTGSTENAVQYVAQSLSSGQKQQALANLLAGEAASGDLYYYDGTGELVRLPKGINGQVLKMVSGVPAWADDTFGALGVGTDGQVLTTVTGAVAWADLPDEPAE